MQLNKKCCAKWKHISSSLISRFEPEKSIYIDRKRLTLHGTCINDECKCVFEQRRNLANRWILCNLVCVHSLWLCSNHSMKRHVMQSSNGINSIYISYPIHLNVLKRSNNIELSMGIYPEPKKVCQSMNWCTLKCLLKQFLFPFATTHLSAMCDFNLVHGQWWISNQTRTRLWRFTAYIVMMVECQKNKHTQPTTYSECVSVSLCAYISTSSCGKFVRISIPFKVCGVNGGWSKFLPISVLFFANASL